MNEGNKWLEVDETTKAFNTRKGVIIKSTNPVTNFESLVFIPGEHWRDNKFQAIVLVD